MMGFKDDLEAETPNVYRCRVAHRAGLMGDDGPLLLASIEDLSVPLARVIRAARRNATLHAEYPLGEESMRNHRQRVCDCFDE